MRHGKRTEADRKESDGGVGPTRRGGKRMTGPCGSISSSGWADLSVGRMNERRMPEIQDLSTYQY